jgi:hypothetical protein
MLARAVASLGLPAISARRLDGEWPGRSPGDDRLRLADQGQHVGPTRPFLVLIERLPLGG